MILNKIHTAFDGIRAENELIMKTKNAVYGRSPKRRAFYALRAAAAACCAAVVCTAAGGYIYFTPVYAVSIDNGYSTELGVNRFDRVVSVESDGAADVMHMNYAAAVSAVLAEGGADEDADVAVSGGSEAKTNEMVTAVEGCRHGGELYCYGADAQTAEDAALNGMTLGRYAAYLELKKYEPELTPEDVAGMTARDIRNRICTHTGEEPQYGCGSHSGHGQSSGNGAHQGQGAGQASESISGNGSGSGSKQGQGRGGGHHGGQGKHKN